MKTIKNAENKMADKNLKIEDEGRIKNPNKAAENGQETNSQL